MRASTVCSAIACPEPAEPGKRYCTRHRTAYDSPRWRRLVRDALLRDRHRCRVCGRPARSVHHTRPLLLGGPMFPPLAELEARCELHNGPLEGVELAR